MPRPPPLIIALPVPVSSLCSPPSHSQLLVSSLLPAASNDGVGRGAPADPCRLELRARIPVRGLLARPGAIWFIRSEMGGDITCGSLLQKLQLIWDEVGESDENRDKVLYQLDQECLDVYKRKVDQATDSRDLLIQALDDSKIELARLLSALGEKAIARTPEKTTGTIKQQLAAIAPTLAKLNKQKSERVREFANVQSQIDQICGEIAGTTEVGERVATPQVNEDDLTLDRFEEFRSQLQDLEKEKSNRLEKVLDYVNMVHDLCTVLGMDFLSTVTEVHPSLDDSIGDNCKSISNDTLSKLDKTVATLKEDKKLRLSKLQDLAGQLYDLWDLMDAPMEERRMFDHVTCNRSASVDEVTAPGALALDLIEQADVEVQRLDQLKYSKMKEIAFKKQTELEDIYAGNIEPSELIADMDGQISKAKEEAFSRKEILDKVERWVSACDGESWLEDYNRDDNRYNSSRGAHLNLKRAEKTRILVNKIPALVETLVAKTRAWEESRGMYFMYDGVRLLAMLDEYVVLRQEREEEKKRSREQKRYTEQQLSPDHEGPFVSRVSPNRPVTAKKVAATKSNGSANGTPPNRRLSISSQQNGGHAARSGGKDGKRDPATKTAASPGNAASAAKEDASSHISGTDPVPSTP
ncbi:hypothetical protein GUJ93_ZPchr0012g20069 [Zizania palustris]|uniref:65-kDa microtubule-associated protein 1 n=1 Tax=Zizania palustris TaxID=103762 RepID=A0A8J5WN40_ZIZPA|nr:hypothetical protein GUJ93_ZPchr0012g20069 [Zizania palustris]